MGARRAKRAEARLVLVEIEDEEPAPAVFDEHDLAIIASFGGDCRHGCNGV